MDGSMPTPVSKAQDLDDLRFRQLKHQVKKATWVEEASKWHMEVGGLSDTSVIVPDSATDRH